ncbi:MAG TPA: PilZ domain-containing protein [bacterium]|jgi:hypothetical protein|nr:PilZ domain-containing protein [bacterium]
MADEEIQAGHLGEAKGNLPKEVQEKRRFERLRANLQIKYSVMTPGEEAGLALADYVAPGTFKANTVEMSDFKKLTTEEVVVGDNISLQGVRISLAFPVAQGARLWLQARIPGDPEPLNAIGEVRWCRSTGASWNAGLKFVGISKADLERVEDFLALQKLALEKAGLPRPTGAPEKRSLERLQASLDIKYRVVGPDEEAALRQNDYAAPGSLKAAKDLADFKNLSSVAQVVSEDISLGGLKISVSNPVAEGMRLLLKVSIPDVPIPVSAIGEVRWCRAVGEMWNAGLMFSGLNKADLDRVDRFLLLQKRAQMSKRG